MKEKHFTCMGRGHGSAVSPATRADWEKARRVPWLADMCRRIEGGEESLKHRLPVWTPHCAAFRNNHRAIADALMPLRRLMLDFDEKGHSAEIMEKALQLQEQGKWTVLLVEESVRRGTHVLVEIPPDMTAEEVQSSFSREVGFQADGVVKDVSRCIYLVPEDHTLYVNERMFETLATSGCVMSEANNHAMPPMDVTHTPLSPLSRGEDFPTVYQNIPYTEIVETLEDQMGGKPEIGARNNFIFAMACHLRYICDDNPDWIARILPTYGEETKKWRETIRSACNRSQTKQMSRVMVRTLAVCRRRMEVESDLKNGEPEPGNAPPPMPAKLPPLIELLVSRTPDVYRPAVAHAVFPALGAHLWKTRFRYIDNVDHEATLMNVLMAGTGAGKNCISEPLNRIMADIRERDKENMRREKEWNTEMQTKGANKDKRARPEGLVVQEVDPDMTNAAFVRRLSEAEERFLYTRMNEIDQFDALRTSSNKKAPFQIMCLAFDPANVYGQTRSSIQAINERTCIRFNWNASTTIRKGQWYFRQVLTDGPISRINFCTIPERPIGAEIPVYGLYDADFDEALKPYIDCLNRARGRIVCPEAEALARCTMEENAEFARLSQSRVYENLSFRANVIAFLKAMVLYVAHGERWLPEMEDFVRWSLRYDMWCKMEFFGQAIEEAESGYGGYSTRKNFPKNLLDLLPDVFTRDDAAQVRKQQGICSGSLRHMLSNWKQRGHIVVVEDANGLPGEGAQRFAKTKEYLMKHR